MEFSPTVQAVTEPRVLEGPSKALRSTYHVWATFEFAMASQKAHKFFHSQSGKQSRRLGGVSGAALDDDNQLLFSRLVRLVVVRLIMIVSHSFGEVDPNRHSDVDHYYYYLSPSWVCAALACDGPEGFYGVACIPLRIFGTVRSRVNHLGPSPPRDGTHRSLFAVPHIMKTGKGAKTRCSGNGAVKKARTRVGGGVSSFEL